MPHLTVVIVSWNVRELLAACLRSLFRDRGHSGLDPSVWIVDNASTDGTPDMVAESYPGVHLVASDENLGFAAANNRVLREILQHPAFSDHEHIFWLLNPDTQVQPGATTALMNALEAEPRAGVVGAKLLYPDGSLQQSAFRFPGLMQLAFELFPVPKQLYETSLNGRYAPRLYESAAPFPVDHPLGASMVVRAKAIREVGLLDEGYHMYCEEIDWCWRMHKAGWRAYCAPAAEVVHHAGKSTSQIPVASFRNLWTSRARLYARHHGPLTWRVARAMVRVSMERRMESTSPEMAEACQDVIQVWENER